MHDGYSRVRQQLDNRYGTSCCIVSDTIFSITSIRGDSSRRQAMRVGFTIQPRERALLQMRESFNWGERMKDSVLERCTGLGFLHKMCLAAN